MDWGHLDDGRAVLWTWHTSSPPLWTILVPLYPIPCPHGTQITYWLLTRFCQYYFTHLLRLPHQLNSGGSKPARCGFLSLPKFSCLSDPARPLGKMQILGLLPWRVWGGAQESGFFTHPRWFSWAGKSGKHCVSLLGSTQCILTLDSCSQEVWVRVRVWAPLISNHSSEHGVRGLAVCLTKLLVLSVVSRNLSQLRCQVLSFSTKSL